MQRRDRVMGVINGRKASDASYKEQRGEERASNTSQRDDDTIIGRALVASLKDCAKRKDIHKGIQIHADIHKKGLLQNNIFVGNSLINMYAKCGELSRARDVFDELKVRTLVSWSTLIAGYSRHGYGEEALVSFEKMQRDGFAPSAITFVCILKACGNIGAFDKGREIHSMILKEGLLQKNNIIGNALVDMYAKCGVLEKAQEVFDELPMLDVISWTALISGYAIHGHNEAALNCFSQMQDKGFSPNAVTFACVLKACGASGDVEQGEDIHAKVVKDELLAKSSILGNALVDMYAKCGLLGKAQQLFDTLPDRDVVSWNVLISGYIRHGHSMVALKYFDRMQSEGVSPDTGTYSCSLKACGNIGATEKGREIHGEIIRNHLTGHIMIGTALVDMYAKSGILSKAQEVFDELPLRDVVVWSVLISGYANHAYGEEALNCFNQMLHDGFSPDEVTLISILKACGNLGASDKGKEVHANIIKDGMLEEGTVIGNALVDMYANFGMSEEAQSVFDKLPVQDLVSWTALISGYALLGMDTTVFYMFHRMMEQGKEPDMVTLTLVLNACNHSGLLDKGQMYFEIMSTCYGVIRTLGHHTCMVDLLGRAGEVEKAMMLIEEMPYCGSLTIWHIILGACQKGLNLKIGRLAFENAIQLDEKDAAAYVCMSNIYASSGMQEEAEEIEALRVKKGAWNSML